MIFFCHLLACLLAYDLLHPRAVTPLSVMVLSVTPASQVSYIRISYIRKTNLVFIGLFHSFAVSLPGDRRERFSVTAALELGYGPFIDELPPRLDYERRFTLVHETPAKSKIKFTYPDISGNYLKLIFGASVAHIAMKLTLWDKQICKLTLIIFIVYRNLFLVSMWICNF